MDPQAQLWIRIVVGLTACGWILGSVLITRQYLKTRRPGLKWMGLGVSLNAVAVGGPFVLGEAWRLWSPVITAEQAPMVTLAGGIL